MNLAHKCLRNNMSSRGHSPVVDLAADVLRKSMSGGAADEQHRRCSIEQVGRKKDEGILSDVCIASVGVCNSGGRAK